MQLPAGARIGTSSPRRTAQLKIGRKDIDYRPIRGNVDTRISKAMSDDYDGVVLAAAGVIRMGMQSQITEYLSPLACPPDPGQGAIAVQIRADDNELFGIVRQLIHRPTAAAVIAERWVLRAAGGGCAVPIGALATVDGDKIKLLAAVTALDGSKTYRVEVIGPIEDPDIIGKSAYQGLLAHGAATLLAETKP
jgi:hydroxymethylbilane synthase